MTSWGESTVVGVQPRHVAFGADHIGVELKAALCGQARSLGLAVTDVGTADATRVDYPVYADHVVRLVVDGRADAGVLICGSGVGMSIAANRHPMIRAALVRDAASARLARQHNAANVLCLGAREVTFDMAAAILLAFLSTPFEGGRHMARVRMLIPAAALG